MERYPIQIEDGTVSIDGPEGSLAVASVSDLLDFFGGETYELEYDPKHATAVDWVSAEADGTMEIDVLETLEGMSYRAQFVEWLTEYSMSTTIDGIPERTHHFSTQMKRVWDNNGNLEEFEENPFR